MGATTGTTSAGKKPFDPYSMAPQTMAANAPSAAYSAGDSGMDRTGLAQMNQQMKPQMMPQMKPQMMPQTTPQATPAQLPGYNYQQAAPTGNIDPYTGTTQSSANMTTAELMAFQDAARAAANPANNPANANVSANGNLNSIQGVNPNVFNPYTTAADPNAGQGSQTARVGTNTFQGANAMQTTNPAFSAGGSQANAGANAIGTLQNPSIASAQGGVVAGGAVTPGTPAGSTSGSPFNNAPNSTVLNPFMMDQARSIMEMQNQNLHEGALMNIRDQSMMNGGYGGDRQGIAEGVAIRGADMNTRSALANLFGGAYESQAGRDLSRYQGDKADATSRFGISTGAQTAAMNLQGQQAMANAQLQAGQENNRNQFYSTQRGQDFEQQRLAMEMYGQGSQGLMSGYQGLGGIYDANQNAPWQQLQNYSNLASPFLGGGSSTGTGPKPDNTAMYASAAATIASAAAIAF